MFIPSDEVLDRLRVYQALLGKSDWTPKVFHIIPLAPEVRDRRIRELQIAYLQHRMIQTRGDL